MAKTSKLTDKQKLFCKYYMISLNATKAGKAAGYSDATQSGWDNLQKPLVIAHLEKLREAQNKRLKLDIDADYVMKRLHAIESFDVTDLYNAEGGLLDVADWPEGAGMVIAGLTLDERKVPDGEGKGGYEDRITKSLKLESRTTALNLLGKLSSVKAFDNALSLENLEGVTFNITMKEG